MNITNMPASNKTISILLVDDERLILMALSRELRQFGYNVGTAESVDDAESWLQNNDRPDLVILDMRMPGGDGLKLALTLEKLNHIPFILQTAFSEQEIIDQANFSGAMAYLVKPVTIKQLIPAIEITLSRAHAFAEMRENTLKFESAFENDRIASVAIGIIMDQYHMSYDQAKESLRKTARSQSIKISKLASNIISSRESLNIEII